jgi:hypothetical protein
VVAQVEPRPAAQTDLVEVAELVDAEIVGEDAQLGVVVILQSFCPAVDKERELKAGAARNYLASCDARSRAQGVCPCPDLLRRNR